MVSLECVSRGGKPAAEVTTRWKQCQMMMRMMMRPIVNNGKDDVGNGDYNDEDDNKEDGDD